MVHGLVNYLLKIGEEEIEGRPCKLQNNEQIRKHEMAINAVMIAINPSIFKILFTKFEKKTVRNYLFKVKTAKYDECLDQGRNYKKMIMMGLL